MSYASLRQTVQQNCDISDARDNGIYSMCILFLRLRNLFKWEKGLAPWEEPEPASLLDWIDDKEKHWASIRSSDFFNLPVNGRAVEPFLIDIVNHYLAGTSLLYGAGFGRSMKAVFFLASKVEERTEQGYKIIILDHEEARELASPFAMSQDGCIYFRKEPFRYFLWDRICEPKPSGKKGLQFALEAYEVLKKNGKVNLTAFKNTINTIVDQEMTPIIHHEIGEILTGEYLGETLKQIIAHLPGTTVELLARALKDVLADTAHHGMLDHIIAGRKKSSLGFYVAFMDGMRNILSRQAIDACEHFFQNGDWQSVEAARNSCYHENMRRAEKLLAICRDLNPDTVDLVKSRVDIDLISQIGFSTAIVSDS